MRRVLLIVLTVLALTALAGEAAASSVTGVTVNNTAASNAAGANTTYVVAFTATSALSGAAGDDIILLFPAGTDLTNSDNGETIRDVTSGTDVGTCSRAGLTATCSLFNGQSIAAGHAVTVTINGVLNPPPAGGLTVQVTTTTDVDPAVSAGYTVVASQPVGVATVVNTSPTNAAGAVTSYVVTFPTSSTGGLDQASRSQITLTFPGGTDLTAFDNGETVRDVTAAADVGSCSRVGLTVTCTLFSNQSIAAGHTVAVTVDGVVNPGAGGGLTVNVDTSSDSPVNSGPYSVVANQPLGAATVDNTSPTNAAGAVTSYVVTFPISSTGGLDQASRSQITLTFPAGTEPDQLRQRRDRQRRDGRRRRRVLSRAGLTVTCTLFSNQTIAAGHTVAVTVDGVVNPGAGGGLTVAVDTAPTPGSSPLPTTWSPTSHSAPRPSTTPRRPTRPARRRPTPSRSRPPRPAAWPPRAVADHAHVPGRDRPDRFDNGETVRDVTAADRRRVLLPRRADRDVHACSAARRSPPATPSR